nr:hypothetical protein CFP56_21183 [Quercus suber]
MPVFTYLRLRTDTAEGWRNPGQRERVEQAVRHPLVVRHDHISDRDRDSDDHKVLYARGQRGSRTRLLATISAA